MTYTAQNKHVQNEYPSYLQAVLGSVSLHEWRDQVVRAARLVSGHHVSRASDDGEGELSHSLLVTRLAL